MLTSIQVISIFLSCMQRACTCMHFMWKRFYCPSYQDLLNWFMGNFYDAIAMIRIRKPELDKPLIIYEYVFFCVNNYISENLCQVFVTKSQKIIFIFFFFWLRVLSFDLWSRKLWWRQFSSKDYLETTKFLKRNGKKCSLLAIDGTPYKC